MEQLEDRTIKCEDCGENFVFTASEQQWYKDKGFQNEPKRCQECRRKRKNSRSGFGNKSNNFDRNNNDSFRG